MRYLFAMFFPPYFVLYYRGWPQAWINAVFCLIAFPMLFLVGFGILIWMLCVFHAWRAIAEGERDKKEDKRRAKEMKMLAETIAAAQPKVILAQPGDLAPQVKRLR